ncbi:MAG TPA: protein kinase [Thermoanaerobaculia bacterium]|nr:protein kinase [Thermoanaerobaculia bacterium]
MEKIGVGGMGEVYRAHDEQLGRDVAVKVLPAEQLGDAVARARLLREARSAAALNHPHICTIHEVGESDGQAYIAMELIEGSALSALIEQRRLTAEEIARYAVQLSDAVAHAHDRGIVHRDLKSGNVMVTSEGRIKVLDFGLAKKVVGESDPNASTEAHTTTLTRPGTVPGTLAYMAPEQLRGAPGDVRSDVWAIGVILYEMVAGERPFHGQTQFELVSSILNDPTPPPPLLKGVIERCLAKDPARRYQRAGEVRAALEAAPSRLRAPRRWIGAALVAAAVVATISVVLVKSPWSSSKSPHIQSLAVLPLENLSGDKNQEYLADGMTEALITDLGSMPGITRVIGRTSVMRYKGSKTPPQEIARELNVDALMTGAVLRSGDRVRVTAALLNPSTGEELWTGRYEHELRDVLLLQNELTRAILTEIRGALTAADAGRLAKTRPVDPSAYEDFLKGKFYWYRFTPADFETARVYFERALQKDPNYAAAYLGLADTIGTVAHMGLAPTTEVFPRAKALTQRAMALDPSLAAAHDMTARLLFAWDWDWPAAEREFKRAIDLNPNYPDAHCIYSQLLQSTNRMDQSIAEVRRSVEIDPQNPFFQENLGVALSGAGRYDEAIAVFRKMFVGDPNSWLAQDGLWDTLFLKGQRDEALKQAKVSFASLGRPDVADAMQGDYRDAMRHGAEAIIAARPKTYMGAIWVARCYAHAGMNDKVLEWLQIGAEERDTRMCYVVGDPLYASARRDPRFQQVLATVRAKAASASR